MRATPARTAALGGFVGTAAGVLVAFAAHWWADGGVTEFGVTSYTPLRGGAAVRTGLAADWWSLLWPAGLAGLVVGALTGLAFSRRRRAASTDWWRPLLALGAAGVLLGTAVATTLYLRAGTQDETTYHGRYVDYLPTTDEGAYSSVLSVTFDERPADVVEFFGVCAGTGLAAGLIAGGALTIARRRRPGAVDVGRPAG